MDVSALAGEVHQWMYDRYSLRELLLEAGLTSPRQVRADESQILDWSSFGLDAEPQGIAHKPDSLFMEAIKAAAGKATTNGTPDSIARKNSSVGKEAT